MFICGTLDLGDGVLRPRLVTRSTVTYNRIWNANQRAKHQDSHLQSIRRCCLRHAGLAELATPNRAGGALS